MKVNIIIIIQISAIISCILCSKPKEKGKAKVHICQHDKIPYPKLVKPPEIKQSSFRQLNEVAWTPIRIQLDFTTFNTYTNIPTELRNELKKILTQSIKILSSLLYVKRTKPIKLEKGVCWDFVKLPSDVTEVDTDLIIFPLINRSYENTLAYATPCENDKITGRPNIGMITFIEDTFDDSLSGYFDRYVNIALHELTHVLGFSVYSFSSFVDENGVKLPKDKIIKEQVINGIQKSFIITPRVVEAAKKHFNCNNIIGVELENQGGSGTAGSHWEGRIMNSDYMTGGLYHELAISEISLAILEDSGLYKANYYTGGLFRFGKNQGCSFLNKPCLINGRTNFPNEYCDDREAFGCTASSIERGVCYIYTHDDVIPEDYQYFAGDPRIGGSYLNDYCPVFIQFERDYDSMSCINGYPFLPDVATGETFSSSSLCFVSNVLEKGNTLTVKYPFCYATECDYENKVLKVTLFKKSFVCPYEGGVVKVDNDDAVFGEFTCPKFIMVCTNKEKCYSISDCVEKKSFGLDWTYDYINKKRNKK